VTYAVSWTKPERRAFERLPADLKLRVRRAARFLGDRRVLCMVNDAAQTVTVATIMPRQSGYRP
jgi:mRNA-degrading endonuclease RelE of RelBE toxin-antitoxin system